MTKILTNEDFDVHSEYLVVNVENNEARCIYFGFDELPDDYEHIVLVETDGKDSVVKISDTKYPFIDWKLVYPDWVEISGSIGMKAFVNANFERVSPDGFHKLHKAFEHNRGQRRLIYRLTEDNRFDYDLIEMFPLSLENYYIGIEL